MSALTRDAAPPPLPPLTEPAGAAQDIPSDASFFDELGDALAVNPPTTPAQRELFAQAQAVAALDEGAARGLERITGEIADTGRVVNGWSSNLDIGTYGDDTLLRAVVARVGWGANVPEEAVYPVARIDADGAQLDGRAACRIRFAAGKTPPVDAFWSLSAYGHDMFFAEHPSGRYTLGDRTPGLVTAADGSLEIVLAHDRPEGATNWLPVPEGPFVLMLRLYLPGQEVLDADYTYPPIERIDR